MDLKVEIIKDKFVSDIYCVENVKFDMAKLFLLDWENNLPERFYEGNYFLFHFDSFLFFHTMHEGIGQYELLKKVIPDLKIAAIAVNSGIEKREAICLDLLKPYGISYDDIIFLENEKPIFEKIFYYTDRVNSLLQKLNLPPGKEVYQPGIFYLEGFKCIREVYNKYLIKDENMPKKIFLTRKKQSDRVRKIYELMRKRATPGNNDIDYSLLDQESENFGGYRYVWQLLEERYFSEEDEIKLENFFAGLGYTIIDPEDFSFYDQINHFYNATHIATIRGSGLLNTLFCQPNTNVFILDVTKNYEFQYYQICSLYTNNVYEIPVKGEYKKFTTPDLYNVNNLIGILFTHYMDRLH